MKPAQHFTDKRVLRSRAAVLNETYSLLSEVGIGGVSIDEVSRRSGVSKTTIYRHWASRSALLLDACSKIGRAVEAPDTGSLDGDLRALLRYVAEELRNARWPAVMPSIIDEAERDPDVARMHAALHAGLMAPFETVAQRAEARGELEPTSGPMLVAATAGPLFYRRWFSKEPLDDAFVERVVRNARATTL